MKLFLLLLLLISPQLVHADDVDKGLEATEDVLEMVGDCLKVGGYALDALEPLGAIADLGAVVLRMIGLFHHRDDPVMKKLDELDTKLDLLGEHMTQQFNELKAFMVETVFYTEIAETASMLHRFMQDTINTPCNESINIFYLEYTRNPPMEYTYRLLSMLDITETNPLKMAMSADPMWSTFTFLKWRSIIDAVTSEFLFIETYANGLFFNNQSMYEPTKMKARLVTLKTEMDGWKKEYMNTYWPHIVQQLMYTTQDENRGMTNDRKARVLRDALSQGITDDAFFIMAYKPGQQAICGSSNNFLTSWQRAGSSLMVFRSQRWKNTTLAERNAFIASADRFNNHVWQYHCTKDYYHETCQLRDATPYSGAFGVAHYKNDLHVESVNNAHQGPDMPGWYFTTTANCHRKHNRPWFGTFAVYD